MEQEEIKNQKDIIIKLASYFAINHTIASSVKNLTDENLSEENLLESKILKKDIKLIQNRNIFLIGAGASTAINHDLFPSGDTPVDLILARYNMLGIFKIIQRESNLTDDEIATDIIEDIKLKMVGMGLSEEAYKNQLFVKNKSTALALRRRAKNRLSKMIQKATSQDNSFETRLSLISEFVNISEIRESIDYLYGYKTYPNLLCEILAHFLKNRFIDGIINFNFDEILDQAIKEEVGMGQLQIINSDANIPNYEEILTGTRLKVPFYIKPHGTASYKSSLRFTKEHYLDLPEEMEHLLSSLFSGTDNKNITKNKQFKVLNLIVAGFQMKSVEFNYILKKSIDKLSFDQNSKFNVFYLSYRDNSKIITKDKLEEEHTKLKKDIIKGIFGKQIKYDNLEIFIIDLGKYKSTDQYSELDLFILELFETTLDNFIIKPSYIVRHKALIESFEKELKVSKKITKLKDCPIIFDCKEYQYNKAFDFFVRNTETENLNNWKLKFYFNTSEYFLNRVIFETAITVIKNKGIIQPKESLKNINRIGYYYNLYSETLIQENKINGTEHHVLAYNEILTDLDLNPCKIDYNQTLFSINLENKDIIEKENDSIPMIEDWIKKKEIQKIIDNNSIVKLLKSDSVSIYPNYQDYSLNDFEAFDTNQIVPTSTARFIENWKMFHKRIDEWNTILMISDRGILLNKILDPKELKDVKKEKDIFIVRADINHLVEFPKLNKISIHSKKIPYYDHNRHSCIYLNISKSNVEFIKAGFYYKKGFSNNVNEILFDKKTPHSNQKKLINTFLGMWAKALFYNNEQSTIKYIQGVQDLNSILETKNLHEKLKRIKSTFLT